MTEEREYSTDVVAVTNGDGGFLVSRQGPGVLAFPRIFAVNHDDAINVAEIFLEGLGLDDALVIDEYQTDSGTRYVEGYSDSGFISDERDEDYFWVAASGLHALNESDAEVARELLSSQAQEASED